MIISTAGDYVRGHLLGMDEAKIVFEVRGEQMELPIGELSEIVWLYERDWKTVRDAEPQQSQEQPLIVSPATQVHAIVGTNQGMTFQPKTVQDGTLLGTSDLLGDASVKLEELTLLFFGPETLSKARQRRSKTYALSLAQMPKDTSQSGESGANATAHPLVGRPAPEFKLQLLSGKSFELSQQKGNIVILDFWASWCGPCMQAMPKLDQLIDEIGNERVQLVAVNIQEARTRIELALQRIQVDCDVALDVDGEVAAAYSANAIPQTVIINPEGRVSHIFVGGGEQILADIREAIGQQLVKQHGSPP